MVGFASNNNLYWFSGTVVKFSSLFFFHLFSIYKILVSIGFLFPFLRDQHLHCFSIFLYTLIYESAKSQCWEVYLMMLQNIINHGHGINSLDDESWCFCLFHRWKLIQHLSLCIFLQKENLKNLIQWIFTGKCFFGRWGLR